MKALTKEDLMYILQSIFSISQQENNAFSMIEDGLYVEDYHNDLSDHENNAYIHVTQSIIEILNLMTVDEYGNLFYNAMPVNISISAAEKNAIQSYGDGLYVKDISEQTNAHLIDETIHVTPEDKANWNESLQQSKDYTDTEIEALPFIEMKAVTELPTENISGNIIYLLKEASECIDELMFVKYIYYNSEWVSLGITNQTIDLLATKEELELYLKTEDSHTHENKGIIDNFSEDETGQLLYNGNNVSKVDISDELNNAIKVIDNKWYVRDFTEEIEAISLAAAFSKTNLLTQDCTEAGAYNLWDTIDNYSMIILEYYYMPDDETESPGNAKTIMLDVNTINNLFEKNIAYLLDLNYGTKSFNSKIRMNKGTMWIDYYHNVCIYKITGIKGGEISG